MDGSSDSIANAGKKVERFFAWMHYFRHLVTRWEYHIENFLGFVHLACLYLLLRHLSDCF